MKIFEKGGSRTCIICNDPGGNKPVALISIDGTQDGYKSEVVLIHVACLELRFQPDWPGLGRMIYMGVNR